MRGGQENKKAADGGERAKARRSPGTTHESSWPAPRAGLSRVFFLARSSQTGRQLSLCSTDSLQLPARLTTGCVLDPCGLAYSLLRPPPVPPKVGPVRGWTTGLPPQAIATRQGRDWAAGPTIAAPLRLARHETGGAGKAAKEGKGFRLGAQAGAAGRSLERGPSGGRSRAKALDRTNRGRRHFKAHLAPRLALCVFPAHIFPSRQRRLP